MTPSNIEPLNGRVFIKEIDEVEEYQGAIELAPRAKEPSNIAEVVALDINYSGLLKIGDRVIFNRHSGSEIQFEKFSSNVPKYRLIKEEDILSRINAD
jgi:co-chaperonin GroES (HSP10)